MSWYCVHSRHRILSPFELLCICKAKGFVRKILYVQSENQDHLSFSISSLFQDLPCPPHKDDSIIFVPLFQIESNKRDQRTWVWSQSLFIPSCDVKFLENTRNWSPPLICKSSSSLMCIVTSTTATMQRIWHKINILKLLHGTHNSSLCISPTNTPKLYTANPIPITFNFCYKKKKKTQDAALRDATIRDAGFTDTGWIQGCYMFQPTRTDIQRTRL